MTARWGATVQCVAGVSRREFEDGLSTPEAPHLLAQLHALSRSWYEVGPGRRVKELVQRLLRAANSLWLAPALVSAAENPWTLGVADFKSRLNEAALHERFAILMV